MRPTNEKRMELLRARRSQIDAELSRLEARLRTGERKADTRRKILLGALVMQAMEAEPERIGAWAKELLETRLTRPRDRSLFNLDGSESE